MQRPSTTFHLDAFDKGDYQKAVEQENLAKTLVEVLYPNDNHYAGKELRLKQQYFFVSASVQTAVNRYKERHGGDVRKLYEKITFQMNDTHPTVTVAELMRILIDEENLDVGRGMGDHDEDAVPTRTTRSWRKPWRNGPSSCSPVCFREFIRL